MGEIIYYPEIRCDVRGGGLLPDGVSARIVDVDGRPQFVQVTRGMINEEEGVHYLPIGFVEIDRKRRRVLIELPAEADSGANRMWVNFDDLRKEASRGTEVVA